MIKNLAKDKVWSTIVKATDSLVSYIAPTFGPSGFKVIVPNKFSPRSPSVLDDGVAICEEFELEDEFENQVVNLIRKGAKKTNSRVGDGTTGSLIMLKAIIDEVNAQGKIDSRKVVAELQKAVKEAKEQLLKKAKKVTKVEELEKVARISFDNEKISKVIANLVYKVGHDGVITIQGSNTMETESEIVDGFEFEKGYISPYMATNQERMEAVIENPYILVTDFRFSLATDAIQLMEKLVKEGLRQVVIVAEAVEGDALATFVVNKMQGKFTAIIIGIPGYDDKSEFLDDLAYATGATVLQKDLNKLEDFKVSMLGEARNIISKPESTVIVGGKGHKADISSAAKRIKTLMEKSAGYKLDQLRKRLGRLVNGVAVIKVGASTEEEALTLKYKVEDAVNAVKVAYKSGIVPGGGCSLSNLKTSSDILNRALQMPFAQLFKNSGIEHFEFAANDKAVFNMVTGKSGDYLEVGVIDPVEVLIAQCESAVSIATLLISTTGILADFKEKETV